MKIARHVWMVASLALMVGLSASGQEQQLYRITSSTTTAITAISPDGWLTWSNAAVDSTCWIERATNLLGSNVWQSYVRHTATSVVTRLHCFDPNPPAGMVLIPGGNNCGTNPLGTGEVYDSHYPQTYSITVDSFYMDRYEVTKALWDEVKDGNCSNEYVYTNGGWGQASNHPVHTMDWHDAVVWCNARSEKAGREPVYYADAALTQAYRAAGPPEPYVKASANGYRLPTDAEWEYAARGGASNKRFPWGGNTISHSQANYYANSLSDYDLSTGGFNITYLVSGRPITSPAGAFETGKNPWGLYDMAGNVCEWCYDWYPGAEGTNRIVRGGSWDYGANFCRVAYRYGQRPGYHYSYFIGFRTVLPAGQ